MLYFAMILLLVALVLLTFYLIDVCDSEIRAILCCLGALVILIVVMAMTVIIAFENAFAQGTKLKYEVKYETLIYQLEEVKYDNLVDNNRKELMDDILSYNKSVAVGQLYQNDFWVGVFYADIYDDLQLIELK